MSEVSNINPSNDNAPEDKITDIIVDGKIKQTALKHTTIQVLITINKTQTAQVLQVVKMTKFNYPMNHKKGKPIFADIGNISLTSRKMICSKKLLSQGAQVKVKFSNENYESGLAKVPCTCHRLYSEAIKK